MAITLKIQKRKNTGLPEKGESSRNYVTLIQDNVTNRFFVKVWSGYKKFPGISLPGFP